MLTKFCSCGAKISITQDRCSKCQEHKKQNSKYYDKHYRKNKDVYTNPNWNRLTNLCKQRCNGLDLYAYYKHNRIIKGSLSHHIIPVEDNKELAYCLENLIYLSNKSHAEIHKIYNASELDKKSLQEELSDYVKRWKQGGG